MTAIEAAQKTQELLFQNPGWKDDFAKYAGQILSRADTIKRNKKLFHQFAPLFLYMNVTEAKSSGTFGIRYAGQQVADLKIRDGEVLVNTKKYDTNNREHFACDVVLHDALWGSPAAARFRKHFWAAPQRNKEAKKQNAEHRIESMLLSELSKQKSAGKEILGVQPVRLFGEIARFQMKTPLSASGNDLKYSGVHGGGIDILARFGRGAKTQLCVIEVKDEAEPPEKVICQAVAYAVFLRELLRSPGGADWYKIFGFKRELPKNLEIIACTAMPLGEKTASNFEGTEIPLGDFDKIVLRSIYFVEHECKLTGFVWK